MKYFCIVFLWLLPGISIAQKLISLNNPPPSPSLFGEGIISTGLSERDFALSPDGSEIFFTLQSPKGIFQTILYCHKEKNGNWSKPVVAPFAGKYSDLEPAFTPDGKKLFFASNRPVNGTAVKDFDIWVVEKENGKWGEPKNLGSPVNTSIDEYYPSITHSGNLYYTAAYKTAVGKEDIFMARWENGKYSDPVPLDTAINSKTFEFNAFVSPDEQFIIFSSYGRKDDRGGGDLYMSMKDTMGQWQPAKNLAMLNSDKLDYCPFVSFDKKILFFTSEKHGLKQSYLEKPADYAQLKKEFTQPLNGGGNIYWIRFEEVLKIFQ